MSLRIARLAHALLLLCAVPTGTAAAQTFVHVDPVTSVAPFSAKPTLIDFDKLATGTAVSSYQASHGVLIEQAGGITPVTWNDPSAPAAGIKVSLFAGGKPKKNRAVLVEQDLDDLWPEPMPPLGQPGAPAALPIEPALAFRFVQAQSRVSFEVRSLDPDPASMLLTVVSSGMPLGTVYLDAGSGFSIAGVQASTPFDELRVDLVNPQTGRLSIDNLRFEPDLEDLDLDGVADFADVCAQLYNPDQTDLDEDGVGDPCDIWPLDPDNDEDGDGLPAELDNCPDVSNPLQIDTDGDGIGDLCDSLPLAIDTDGDGIEDELDNCPITYNENQLDCDGDGIGDVCDNSLITPASVALGLKRGESALISQGVCLPPLPPLLDVLILIDVTGSMGGEIASLQTNLVTVIQSILELDTSVVMGLASFKDYPGTYDSCGYSATYGQPTDYPFRVEEPMTNDFATLRDAVGALSALSGKDGPEAYTRALWEVVQPDSGIGFRPSSVRYVVMIGDRIPHDCDLGEGINCPGLLTVKGIDPGRDEVMFTADDLDFHDDALAGLLANNVGLMTVFSGQKPGEWCAWQDWSRRSFGDSLLINPDGTLMPKQSILGDLKKLVGEGAENSDHGLTFGVIPTQLQLSFNPQLVSGPLTSTHGPIGFETTVTVPASLPLSVTSLQATWLVHLGGVVIANQTIDVTVLP